MDSLNQIAPRRRVLLAAGFVVGLLCLTSSAFAQAKDTDVHHGHAFVRWFLRWVTLLLRRGLCE
jgi:hypothetical protein